MKFAIPCFFLISLVQTIHGQDLERFPYEATFRGGAVPPGIAFAPAPNSATFVSEGLRLTNTTQQFGGVAIDNVSFNSANGLEIEFEYLMYGGSQVESSFGDGFTFFLYDAAETFMIGARGGALGYVFNRASTASFRQPGLNGAYLGIGFDLFGNFKYRRFQPESRINGVLPTLIPISSNGRSHITLRGAMHPTGLSGGGLRGLRNSGYPILITQSTLTTGSGNFGAILNETGGGYTGLPQLSNPTSFSLRPSSQSSQPGDVNYRKAFITLLPNVLGGYNVTVKVQHGQTVSTIIENYHYRTSFEYQENANGNTSATSTTEGATVSSTVHTLDAAIPSSFKVGFAGATGGASQIQIIRDLVIRLPFMPEMNETIVSMCGTDAKEKVINAFENIIVYNGAITDTPVGGNSNEFIDFDSFLFEDENGTFLGNNSYTQLNIGTWTYSNSTGNVTFEPVKGFFGTAQIYFSVKGLNTNGGPFGQEIYRSEPTRIAVEVIPCNGVVNPALPSGRRVLNE